MGSQCSGCGRGAVGEILPVSSSEAGAPAVESPDPNQVMSIADGMHEVKSDGSSSFVDEKALASKETTYHAPAHIEPLSSALGQVDESDMFSITLMRGDGISFQLRCHAEQSIGELHTQISESLGPQDCPKYAIRLIHRVKVLSLTESATLSSFGVAEGEVVHLLIVRDAAAMRLLGNAQGNDLLPSSVHKPGTRRLNSRRRSSLTSAMSRHTNQTVATPTTS